MEQTRREGADGVNATIPALITVYDKLQTYKLDTLQLAGGRERRPGGGLLA